MGAKFTIDSDRVIRTIVLAVSDVPDMIAGPPWRSSTPAFRPDRIRLVLENGHITAKVEGPRVLKSGKLSKFNESHTFRTYAWHKEEKMDAAPQWLRDLIVKAKVVP